ncbi:putative bifunctional diguanylate cyclase/phosphodiesterase [Rubrivivax albus]|uniref:GGDEF domain-containing protein n=1 Tax=Rubrivivax albus TaxID=2499835 RepID=A0A437JZA3_9BURK|nr:GGDEF domain-containing protein [Rubrivivax albus]RVT53389.1 GGDEF domain-containing protein [Rubrivivax albus]
MVRSLRGSTRLVVLVLATTTVLVLLMQWFVISRTVPAVEANERRSIDELLASSRDVWVRRHGERTTEQTEALSLILADQGWLATLHPEPMPAGGLFGAEYRATLADVVDNFGTRAGYSFAALLQDDGTPLLVQPALPEADTAALVPSVRRLVAEVEGRPRRGKLAPSASTIVALGERAYRVVVQELGTQDRRRWMAMAFAIDDEMAALHQDMHVHATLLAGPESGLVPVFTTLPDRAQAQRLAALDTDAEELRGTGDPVRVRSHLVGDAPDGRIVLRLSRSLASAEAEGERMRQELTGFVALGLAAFAALMWLLSRWFVTRSLDGLVGAARRLGRQDYDVAVPVTGPVREFRQLAFALDTMRQDLRAEEYFDRRLTQLPNRLHFRRELDKALAEARPVTVLLVGLNRFKEINRRIGYTAGDRLLKAMAERLVQVVRPGDFVARLGGDLFGVLLAGADHDSACRAAERIGRELEQPLDLDGNRVDRQAAIGIAMAPLHADAAEPLLARAELALYAAKDRRESFIVYDAAFDRESEANLALLSELRHARDNGELRLHLQPKVDLKSGRIAGAEALLRWVHPQRGLIPPGRFIPYAEDTPIIKDLTLWVFEAAVREQPSLRAHGIGRVSINLSARDLMDLDLPAKLDALLSKHGAEASGLCLETTESAVMGDIARAQQTLTRLRERGYKLSIDDFGEGQTSMRYLKDLPVHELKVDMVFIKGMQTDPRTEYIVKALIEVGHQYGLSVVAEGVENAAVALRLAELGCNEGQGWHFGKPMPADELYRWARAWTAREEQGQPA